jgi:hypothetical protein
MADDGGNAILRMANGRVLAALGGAAGIMMIAAGGAHAQDAPPDFGAAIQQGTPILEFRPRFEDVSQTGRLDGEAFTARTRLGWQTARWYNLQGLIEFEDVRQLGPENYDTNVNGRTAYAQIFDPDVTELNRLQVVWTPDSWFTATLGRQRINLGDQRFIGGVAWRQDEQTFDAAKFDADLGRFDITYAYIGHVNRIFAEAQDWDSNSHVVNASYTFADPLKVTAFAYALDFNKPTTPAVRNQSNVSYGVRATGKQWFGAVNIAYSASYATQTEYGESLLDYELDMMSADVTATLEEFSGRLSYESLEGNGTRGFATPLATLHAFQGWSDAFIVNGVKTTVDGINDLNATITWSPRWKWDYLFNLSFLARYHDFEAERTGADLGTEWNLQAAGAITPRLSWLLKYADYDGPGVAPAPADRTKWWFGFEWRL